ncbi:hypothetical protein LAZ67_15002719 [Cordylochernes scorpioides]|uniref:Uncharacterized protein n=1 Tax=Cordylochernes scorpioides TaxID=51811 RepID=A0ABY6LEK9_9ARAC|nr:hypothetical protein LAZ67_15002719 [Cordylochernes scorpioides]
MECCATAQEDSSPDHKTLASRLGAHDTVLHPTGQSLTCAASPVRHVEEYFWTQDDKIVVVSCPLHGKGGAIAPLVSHISEFPVHGYRSGLGLTTPYFALQGRHANYIGPTEAIRGIPAECWGNCVNDLLFTYCFSDAKLKNPYGFSSSSIPLRVTVTNPDDKDYKLTYEYFDFNPIGKEDYIQFPRELGCQRLKEDDDSDQLPNFGKSDLRLHAEIVYDDLGDNFPKYITNVEADLAPKEMAASDKRNRRHVQPLLTWSTNAAHPVSLDQEPLQGTISRAS